MESDNVKIECPYCGKEMKLLEKKSSSGKPKYQFYCTKCKAKSPMADTIENTEWLSKDGAIWYKTLTAKDNKYE